MEIWGALLILLAAVAALVLICGMTVRVKRKHQRSDYDERQILFQGKAYGFGLIIGAVYFVFLSSALLLKGESKLNADLLSLIVWDGILLTYTAVNVYCLMTGALLPLNNAINPVLGMSYAFAILKLIRLITHICFHGMSMGDDPMDTWEDLTGVVFWTLHAAMYMIAKRREKRESDG